MSDLYTLAINAVRSAERRGQPEPPAKEVLDGCEYQMILSQAGRCGRKLLDEKHCFWHSTQADKISPEILSHYFGADVQLQDALEMEVAKWNVLEGIILPNANVGGTFLNRGASLKGADLRYGKFQGSSFSYCDLSGALLMGANLNGAKLSECNFTNTNFARAHLYLCKFRESDLSSCKGLRQKCFTGFHLRVFPIHRMLEVYPDQAETMYRELTKYFSARGLYDDASWSAYRAGLLRHRQIVKMLNWKDIKSKSTVAKMIPNIVEPSPSPGIEWLYAFVDWLRSMFSLVVIGFGERPSRVIGWATLAVFGFALIFMLPGGPSGGHFSTSLYFSIITFTTLGYGDLVPKGGFRLVAGAEALSGVLLVSLFIFCLGRRTVSRA